MEGFCLLNFRYHPTMKEKGVRKLTLSIICNDKYIGGHIPLVR